MTPLVALLVRQTVYVTDSVVVSDVKVNANQNLGRLPMLSLAVLSRTVLM